MLREARSDAGNGTGPADAPVSAGRRRGPLRRLAREAGLTAVVILLLLGFGAATPSFLNAGNVLNVLVQASVVGILAVGTTYVLLTAGIDLSIGSIVALAALGGALFADTLGPWAILVAIGVGALAGLCNGLLITLTGITPFIVTLGTMSIYSGLALILSGGRAVYGVPDGFRNALAGAVAEVPLPVAVLVVVGALGTLVMSQTRFGQYLVAIGGNPEVAHLAGIDVRRFTTGAYVVSGAAAGLAGAVLVARLGTADPTVGGDLLLVAIAAAVMGGTKLSGGEASVPGAVIGAVLLAVLTAGLTSLNVQAFYQQVAVGAVIILALLVDRVTKGRA